MGRNSPEKIPPKPTASPARATVVCVYMCVCVYVCGWACRFGGVRERDAARRAVSDVGVNGAARRGSRLMRNDRWNECAQRMDGLLDPGLKETEEG